MAMAAQEAPQTFTSPVTGANVEIHEPWAFDLAGSIFGAEADVLKLDSGFANVLIGLMPANTPLLDADTAVVRPFADDFGTILDIQSADANGFRYSLNLVVIHGVEYGAFSLYTPLGQTGSTEAYVYLAPVSRFAEGMQDAREGISIDRMALFDAFDGAALQAMLEDRAGATGGVFGARVNDAYPPLGSGDDAPVGTLPGRAPSARKGA